MCCNQNDKKLKFYIEIRFTSRAIPIYTKGSANYESPCTDNILRDAELTTVTDGRIRDELLM